MAAFLLRCEIVIIAVSLIVISSGVITGKASIAHGILAAAALLLIAFKCNDAADRLDDKKRAPARAANTDKRKGDQVQPDHLHYIRMEGF